nr:DUF2341 domain-containing protein [Fibrobacterota bacterium]
MSFRRWDMRTSPTRAILLGAMAAYLASCNFGSETGNPTKVLEGSFKTLDGLPAARTQVYLVPKDFNPLDLLLGSAVTLHVDTTDAQGRYHFTGVDSGRYNLQANSLLNGTGLLVKDIPVAGPRALLPTHTLRSSGRITAGLEGADDTDNGYVYILGTTFYEKVGASSKTISLDSIPPGLVDSLIYGNSQGTVAPKSFAWNLNVKSDTSLEVPGPYLAWKHSAMVLLNTTSTGVKISGHVAHFPLRIDLASTRFDFTSSRPDGADLRATNERGDPLPCELQLWDAASQSGQIWVRVDSVFADSLQKIRLYWGYGGQGAIPSAWPAGSVFSAADGFVASWHLDSDPFLSGQQVPDFSQGQNDGLAIGFEAPGGTAPGVIGNGLAFDGKTRFLTTRKGFDNPKTFTYAGWFKTSTVDGGRLFDFSESDTSLAQAWWDRLISMDPNGTLHFGVYPPIVPGTPMPTVGTHNILDAPNP